MVIIVNKEVVNFVHKVKIVLIFHVMVIDLFQIEPTMVQNDNIIINLNDILIKIVVYIFNFYLI